MGDSSPPPGADKGHQWDLLSGASSPLSDTSSNSASLFSSPNSPVDTELSFPSLGLYDAKNPANHTQKTVAVMPSFTNHVLVGNTAYAPGQIQAMRDILEQARSTSEFPKTTSTVEDPQAIVEDYKHLQRLRDARGDPALPPSERYNVLKVDIARRIKARDEAQGGSSSLQEMDHRVQGWMNSINKETRMLEITQAALQRKGISNPTQDDLDAIAEEFMQIAERTLLDVANPLRMNATRMEGNIDRFDSQLNGLSSIDGAMTAQLNTLNSVMSNLQSTVGNAVNMSTEAMGASTKSMSTAMGAQINTLNAVLGAQSNTFNGSLTMLNTALGTVQDNLHQLTTNLPAIIATAVQAAVHDQLASAPHQHLLRGPHQANFEQPPGYATINRTTQCRFTDREAPAEYLRPASLTPQVLKQHKHEHTCHLATPATKSKLRRFLRGITKSWRSTKGKSRKETGSQ